MLNWIVSTALVIGFADATADRGIAQDDTAKRLAELDAKQEASANELAELAAKVAKFENYQFTTLNETEGGAGAGGGGRGGQAREPQAPVPVKGAWTKDAPMQITIGDVVAYKDGDQLVHKNEAGEWQLFEMPERGGFGRGERGGNRGGDRPQRGGDDEGGDEGGDGERPQRGERGQRGEGGRGDRGGFAQMRGLMTASRVEAPHTGFADFAKKVSGVKKKVTQSEDADAPSDLVVYTGELTEAGTDGFGGGGAFRGRGGRGGGGGGGFEMETTGTFTIEVKAGILQSAKFSVTRSGTFGDRDFERTSVRTVTFSEVGKTKLEIPEGALAQFEI